MSHIFSDEDLQSFKSLGFLKIRLLCSQHSCSIAENCSNWLKKDKERGQHLLRIPFLNPDSPIPDLFPLITHPVLRHICSFLLGGGEVVLDGAAFFYAPQGFNYTQGWHRDVMQLSSEEIRSEWFSPDYFHNNLQVNIALAPDSCFHFVPGSHIRVLNKEEESLFNGGLITAEDAPQIGVSIALEPGEAVIYNNLGVHRGWCNLN